MQIETVKIKSRDPEQGEFIMINAEDFNAETDEIYVEAEAQAALSIAIADAKPKRK